MSTILESCYAAARKHLRDARVCEDNAVLFSMRVFKAGHAGREARFMRDVWTARRLSYLDEALRIRRQIRELRKLLAA